MSLTEQHTMHWKDCKSRLAWEHLRILLDELEDGGRGEGGCFPHDLTLNKQKKIDGAFYPFSIILDFKLRPWLVDTLSFQIDELLKCSFCWVQLNQNHDKAKCELQSEYSS